AMAGRRVLDLVKLSSDVIATSLPFPIPFPTSFAAAHAADQAHEHCDDAQELLPSCDKDLLLSKSRLPTDIQDSGAFGRGSKGHPIEPRLVSAAELARPFCNIEDYGSRCAAELIRQIRSTWWKGSDHIFTDWKKVKGDV